ncbi:MAG: transferrin-binding protein-like solute binding protein [Pseudomonadota bacterium]
MRCARLPMIAATMLVSGCLGSGGGGGASSGAAVAPSAAAIASSPSSLLTLSPNSSFQVEGESRGVDVESNGLSVTSSDLTPRRDLSVLIETDANANFAGASFTAAGRATDSFLANETTLIVSDADGLIAETADGFITLNSTYEYQTFGFWGVAQGPSGRFNFGSAGFQTNAANLPLTSANYTGDSIGAYAVSGGGLFATSSAIEVDANFQTGAASITSTNTVMFDGNQNMIAAPMLDFSGSGSVTGASLAATVETSASALSGDATGLFYGPAAEEVGGSFALTGGSGDYVGAFGAEQ